MTPSGRAGKTGDPGKAETPPADQGTLYRQLPPGPGSEQGEVQAHQRSRLMGATIELAGERGYDGTTVADIVRLAGVSKASFYEHFSGKDECFIATFDAALRAAARAVLRGEISAGDGRDRRDQLRAGLTALAELIAAQPKGAKLVLVDGQASTPAIRGHVSRRFGLLQALVRERLATPSEGKLPNPLIAGIVRGIEHHARRCVGAERPDRFRGLVEPLLDWGLGFNCEEASATFAATSEPTRVAISEAKEGAEAGRGRAAENTRDLLIAATLQLASREGFAALTPSRIRRAAGVSRQSFDANFDDAAGCFLAAVGAELDEVFATALRAAAAEADWGEGTCMALDRFAFSLVGAPDLARLAFVETLEAAPASLQWRESLVADWAEALYCGAPTGYRPSPAVAESTVAAIWGFLADIVAARRLDLLPTQTSRLAFFALAPALGAREAVKAIRATRDPEEAL
jgi:AcrR family transcriptional regulator